MLCWWLIAFFVEGGGGTRAPRASRAPSYIAGSAGVVVTSLVATRPHLGISELQIIPLGVVWPDDQRVFVEQVRRVVRVEAQLPIRVGRVARVDAELRQTSQRKPRVEDNVNARACVKIVVIMTSYS